MILSCGSARTFFYFQFKHLFLAAATQIDLENFMLSSRLVLAFESVFRIIKRRNGPSVFSWNLKWWKHSDDKAASYINIVWTFHPLCSTHLYVSRYTVKFGRRCADWRIREYHGNTWKPLHCRSSKSGGSSIATALVYVGGATAVAAGATVGLASYNPRFRRSLESQVPQVKPVLNAILDENPIE